MHILQVHASGLSGSVATCTRFSARKSRFDSPSAYILTIQSMNIKSDRRMYFTPFKTGEPSWSKHSFPWLKDATSCVRYS